MKVRINIVSTLSGIFRILLSRIFNLSIRLQPEPTLDFDDNSQVKYIGELNSFTGDGMEWESVSVFENLIQTDDRLPRKIYYAKGIGVVRKELFNG